MRKKRRVRTADQKEQSRGAVYENWQIRAEAAEREVIRIRGVIDAVDRQAKARYAAELAEARALATTTREQYDRLDKDVRALIEAIEGPGRFIPSEVLKRLSAVTSRYD